LDLLIAPVYVPGDGVEAEHLLAQLDRKLQRLKTMPKQSLTAEAPVADQQMTEALKLQWRTTVV